MKLNKYSLILLFFVLFILSSCNKWLDVLPENDQTSGEYWQTKEEVEAVLANGYVKLRSSVEYLYIWGEARGNGVDFLNISVGDMFSAYKLRELDILPTNKFTKWGSMYQIINMANSVIKYAPDVAEKDASFNVNIMNSYLSEAYFLRSLAYFYLVRTFKDVPFVLEPYINDEAPYEIAKTDGNVILDYIIKDLEKALPSSKEYFQEKDPLNPVNTKGRATRWAIHALLADINLWKGDYNKCISSCDAIIYSKRVGLINRNLWYTNFYPGNSNESIFEIQYDYAKGQTNDFITWFSTDKRYIASLYTLELFYKNSMDARTDSTGDVRGYNSSFYNPPYYLIWKFIGINNDLANPLPRTSSNQNDQNFLIYRLADIMLMKAEALIMQGNFAEAKTYILKIRERAGLISEMPSLSNESDALDFLLEERHRELFAEGKNWFDILRIAQRDNYKYKEKLIEQALFLGQSNNAAIIRSKLSDVNSFYLPINSDELKYNLLLVQNPYYENLGK